jgi:hypothetical protein
MVTRLDQSHTGTHLLYDASTFMPYNYRGGHRHIPFHEMKVTVTDPASHELHQHLVLLRGLQSNLFYSQRFAHFM